MKLILIAALVFTSCTTTTPEPTPPQIESSFKTKCVGIETETGQAVACPMPGNVICFEKNGYISCVQILGPPI